MRPALLVLLLALCTNSPMAAADDVAKDHFTRTLYLIRHGAYDTAASADPETGPDLTPLGIAQARLIAARLRGLSMHWDTMISSTMTRARETAAVMHETLTDVALQQTPLLSECTPPMTGAAGAQERDLKEAAECQNRLDQAFSQFFVPTVGASRNDILVCHGNVIRYFVMKALGVDTQSWIKLSVAHTSVTVIAIRSDGHMAVLSVGDVGHLPPNLQSGGADPTPELRLPKTVGP